MKSFKKIFTSLTGYWLHKLDTLPVGSDLFVDIHQRLKYGNIKIMFDVGANNGQTFNWFRLNEALSRIYAFEPVSNTFAKLKSNTASDNNCVVENIAFGERPGEKKIKLFDDYSVLNSLKDELMNQSKNAIEETITLDTIDLYCAKNNIDKIDLLKIDTEGYEMNVLAGAEEMLQSAKISFVYCETGLMKQNTRNTYFAELTEWLAAKDYNFFSLYHTDTHDWKGGQCLSNALYVHKSL